VTTAPDREPASPETPDPLDCPRMDPRDRLSDPVDGAECAACGRTVPREDVRLLARREDLAFAELPCGSCGSISLAIFVGPTAGDLDVGEQQPAAIGPDDVLDMHLLLETWKGDLRSLVRGPSGGAPRAR